MKLIVIGVGGSGASCIECLVHLAAIGVLPGKVELIPVIVDPDQQHPRIQATSRFIASYVKLRDRGAAATLVADGLLGTKMSRIVSTNALRPSEKENLFSLIGLSQPTARTLATLFFAPDDLGSPRSREFADGYYGRVNAGVCFFNDPPGRQALRQAVRHYILGDDAVVVLIGSSFGGTGAAGLIHLARLFREDDALKNARFSIGAIQLEPYFKPDQPHTRDTAGLVNLPDTFESRTGAAYQFLAGLAEARNIPFDAFYPLGVRVSSTFPPDWFKVDQQNNPHLFLEYLAALAVRDFALNHEELRSVARHRSEAVPVFDGPLAVLRQALHDATAMQRLLSSYILPLLQAAGPVSGLPGHPWIANVCATAGLESGELVAHLTGVRNLLTEVLVNCGIDRTVALERAGAVEIDRETTERKNDLTRASFPTGFAPVSENLVLAETLRSADPETLFASYDVVRDAKLPSRALHRWVASAVHPESGGTSLPGVASHTGPVFHQWRQQDGPEGTGQKVLGIEVPADNEFQSSPMQLVLSRLAAATWRRPALMERTAAEYPTVWAPALVHRDELYSEQVSPERRYLHLGLIASVMLRRRHLITPPVRLVRSGDVLEAFRCSIDSTFPLGTGSGTMIAPGGLLTIYERSDPLPEDATPSPEDVVGFFYPDTIVVPAAGISPANRDFLIEFGRWSAGRGFARMLHAELANDWPQTLASCEVPGASERGTQLIDFLDTFDDPFAGDVLGMNDRFAGFPVRAAAAWIHRLYR